uniref:Nucleolar protein 14 n=1 Tax=Plectus sambesii TaxID=2011161 RepID=A0A914X2X6_9BILA
MGADGSMAHRSADDDDENMERFEKSDFVVKYGPDGLLLNSEKVEKPTVRVVRIDNESSDEDEEYEEDEDEEGEDDDEDEDGEEDDDGEASELSGDDDVDGHQDDDDEDEEPFEEIIKAPSEKRAKKATAAAPEKKKDKKSLEGGKLAKAGNSLPFVFDMPKSYEAFKELLHNRPAAEVALITERLIKCHHPSLKEGNKQRLARLFMFALRYFDETAANKESVDVAKLDSLTKTLYALLRFNPDDGAKCVRALLKRFRTLAVKKRRRIPGFNVVAFLRLVPTLFPASDVWHPVVTPCFIVATHILSNAHIISPRDAAIGLLLCSTLVEYVCDGKRYLPEVIAFLRGVLLTAIDHKEEERSPTGTFPISQPHRTMLLIKQKTKQVDVQPVSLSEVVTSPKSDNSEVSEQFKLSIIRCTVGLVQKFAQIYSQTTAYGAIFRPFEQLLSRLPVENYPEALAEDVGDLRKTLNAELSIRSRLLQLQRQKTQKPMVKMLEPRFEENFDPERPRLNRDANRKGKKAEDKRMVHKYKKELRGTVRELRRDNQFLAREQRKEAMSRDSDRRAKTKNLMKSLMGQEADYKQLNKKKKFK